MEIKPTLVRMNNKSFKHIFFKKGEEERIDGHMKTEKEKKTQAECSAVCAVYGLIRQTIPVLAFLLDCMLCWMKKKKGS